MVVALIALAACNPHTTTRGDDDPGDPGDADAAIEGPSTRTLACDQPFTQTSRHQDGTSNRTTYRYAMIEGLALDDDYTVEVCDAVPSCGPNCTGSAYPPGERCVRWHRTGTFYAGKLAVPCGNVFEQYDANGNRTSRTESPTAMVRLTMH
jgi:hypothetical protein